jgi:hypothetical protein
MAKNKEEEKIKTSDQYLFSRTYIGEESFFKMYSDIYVNEITSETGEKKFSTYYNVRFDFKPKVWTEKNIHELIYQIDDKSLINLLKQIKYPRGYWEMMNE